MDIDSNISNASPGSNTIRVIGVGLMLLSGVFFFVMLAVPLLSLSVGNKTLLAGALFVCVQTSWWVGVAMVGPAAIAKVKTWFGSGRKA